MFTEFDFTPNCFRKRKVTLHAFLEQADVSSSPTAKPVQYTLCNNRWVTYYQFGPHSKVH